MTIGPYFVGQIPLQPLNMTVLDENSTPVDLSQYTSFELKMIDPLNKSVDTTSGTFTLVPGEVGKILFTWPEVSLFTVIGRYSYQLRMDKSPVSVVQVGTGQASLTTTRTGTEISVTFPSPLTLGNLLVLCVAFSSTTPLAPVVQSIIDFTDRTKVNNISSFISTFIADKVLVGGAPTNVVTMERNQDLAFDGTAYITALELSGVGPYDMSPLPTVVGIDPPVVLNSVEFNSSTSGDSNDLVVAMAMGINLSEGTTLPSTWNNGFINVSTFDFTELGISVGTKEIDSYTVVGNTTSTFSKNVENGIIGLMAGYKYLHHPILDYSLSAEFDVKPVGGQ